MVRGRQAPGRRTRDVLTRNDPSASRVDAGAAGTRGHLDQPARRRRRTRGSTRHGPATRPSRCPSPGRAASPRPAGVRRSQKPPRRAGRGTPDRGTRTPPTDRRGHGCPFRLAGGQPHHHPSQIICPIISQPGGVEAPELTPVHVYEPPESQRTKKTSKRETPGHNQCHVHCHPNAKPQVTTTATPQSTTATPTATIHCHPLPQSTKAQVTTTATTTATTATTQCHGGSPLRGTPGGPRSTTRRNGWANDLAHPLPPRGHMPTAREASRHRLSLRYSHGECRNPGDRARGGRLLDRTTVMGRFRGSYPSLSVRPGGFLLTRGAWGPAIRAARGCLTGGLPSPGRGGRGGYCLGVMARFLRGNGRDLLALLG